MLTTRIKELFSSLSRWISCFHCSICLFSSSSSLILRCICRSFLIQSCCFCLSLSSKLTSCLLRRSFSITSSLNDFLSSLSVIESALSNNLSTLMVVVNGAAPKSVPVVDTSRLLISSECDLANIPCLRCRALALGRLAGSSNESKLDTERVFEPP